MWDYDAFPVWRLDVVGGMVQPDRLPVSAGLRLDLQEWSDRVTEVMWGADGPDAPGWREPGRAVLDALDAEAVALGDRLREELPEGFSVEVWQEGGRS